MAKITIVGVLLVLTILVSSQWLLHQSIFRVQHVSMSGEVHETSAQILTTAQLETHPAMINLSQATVLKRLSVYPWIGGISLIKRWPNTIQLAIHEVRAVAVAFDPRRVLYYVSTDGRKLGAAPATSDLPTLLSVPGSLGARTWPYRGEESSGALVASQLPPAFAAQVRQVIVSAQGNVTLQLTTPLRFYLGPATNLAAKFMAVASAIAHANFAAGDLVDVTTPSELSVTGPPPS